MKMNEGHKKHLKEWLLAQVESGAFEGLRWEDEEKTMFRIPWKHAAKKDYKETDDAALFKAWALHKGKHREGKDRANPTVWKTRLRCALNKSTDFQMVPELSQLDISEPYKVYRIQRDESPQTKDSMTIQVKASPRSPGVLEIEESFQACQEEPEEEQQHNELIRDHMYCEPTGKKSPTQHSALLTFCSSIHTISDFRMQVTLLYHGHSVMRCTTKSPDGCFIVQGRGPVGSERIYGPCTAQQISFPSPNSLHTSSYLLEAINRLLCHLERGVLLWVAPDGVFIKRFCQGRVYWSGPMAPHTDRPNKLEREKTLKLLDTSKFLNDLQSCFQGKGTPPLYRIELCFGEEYPDPATPKTRKLVMVQVVPMFAVDLLQRFSLEEMKNTTDGPDTNDGKAEKVHAAGRPL
ncbi:interferon regulatory factor 10 isoform X1 [Dunckerocampus dactyliophorus]|uniref:interferon regulatory factor 10 isoform X1 n=1 Tax=Dunckerocampus dactyliophorus TaxID=161453 RepID=UPI0024072115|nr:interferon regulatory factor 10 isoform X1 [Dunckerocampus dactyliophorus]